MLKRITMLVCLLAMGFPCVNAQGTGRVAVVGGDLSPDAEVIARNAIMGLQGMGINCETLTSNQMADSATLMQFDLLVYAGAEAVPVTATRPLQDYLEAGRDLIALGAPPFSCKLWPVGDSYISQDEMNRQLIDEKPVTVVMDFEPAGQHEGWSRETNDLKAPSTVEFPTENGNTFYRANLANLTSWDTFSHVLNGMGADDSILKFKVRGAAQTRKMVVELVERDGTRWMAIPSVSADWSTALLWPQDFHYWHDSNSSTRGGSGDTVKFSQVVMIKFGEALSHISLPQGPHRLDVDDVALINNPIKSRESGQMPPIEGLSPDNKFFPVTDVSEIIEAPDQVFVSDLSLIEASSVASVSPRPMGSGYLKGRTYRFVPLINTYNKQGRRSGYLAWLMINNGSKIENKYTGGAWAVFGTSQPEAYMQASMRKAIGQVAQALLRGTYLMEGGSEFFFYLDRPEQVLLGSHSVVNLQEKSVDALGLRWTVKNIDTGKTVFQQGQALYRQGSRMPDSDGSLIRNYQQFNIEDGLEAGTYVVSTEMLDGNRVIDCIEHELNVWKPKSPGKRHYVKNVNGNFMLDGKPWFAFGVNYMPSSGVALESSIDFEHYVNQTAYDPAIIDEDLEMLSDIGFNMISVFVYHQSINSWNMMDLITRADKYGIKVNLSLRPHADPMQFNISEVEDFIKVYQLDQNDAVMAYDLAWEKNWGKWDMSYGTDTGRKGHDAAWLLWIEDQYGSVAAAEKEWGFKAQRKLDGIVTGPSDEQIDKDGEWRKMVAAYRSFVDYYSGFRMMKASDAIRVLDPHHMVSFRMHMTGDPTQEASVFTYDMKGMAPYMDIMEPEAYGRIGDWENVKPGLFTVAYGRMAAPDKPLIWSEFGYHIWDGSNFIIDPDREKFQADFYRDFLTMSQMGHVNGVSCWYSAGGFRNNENSDYGIINPDKSDRPVTAVLREFAPILKNTTLVPKPDVFLTIDREATSRGINDEYVRLEDAFWKATDAGKYVGLTNPGVGTTSSNVPAVAVGEGSSVQAAPAKFINATFRKVQVRQGWGPWVTVQNGDSVPVRKGASVKIRALVTNTDNAKWVAPGFFGSDEGSVFMVGRVGDKDVCRVALEDDTSYLVDGQFEAAKLIGGVNDVTEFELTLTAKGRMDFGEVFHLTLMPK